MLNDTISKWGMDNGEENRNYIINPSAPVYVIDGAGGNSYTMFFTDGNIFIEKI